MLTSSSPLLEGRHVGVSSERVSHIASTEQSQRPSTKMWKRVSMPSLILNLVILSALIYGAGVSFGKIWANLLPTNQYCLHSVSTSYNYLTFSGPGYGSFYGPKCLNPTRIVSTFASGKTFCTDREIDIGFEKIREECEHQSFEFPNWRELTANITDDDIAQMRVVDFGEIPPMVNTTEPVRVSEPFFERVDTTLVSWMATKHRVLILIGVDNMGI